MLEALVPQKAAKAVAPQFQISIGDSMGAATAFRSCEAAGAPMPAFYRAVLLMRRELLKWASAPFSTSGRAASLDAARGAALCTRLPLSAGTQVTVPSFEGSSALCSKHCKLCWVPGGRPCFGSVTSRPRPTLQKGKRCCAW